MNHDILMGIAPVVVAILVAAAFAYLRLSENKKRRSTGKPIMVLWTVNNQRLEFQDFPRERVERITSLWEQNYKSTLVFSYKGQDIKVAMKHVVRIDVDWNGTK